MCVWGVGVISLKSVFSDRSFWFHCLRSDMTCLLARNWPKILVSSFDFSSQLYTVVVPSVWLHTAFCPSELLKQRVDCLELFTAWLKALWFRPFYRTVQTSACFLRTHLEQIAGWLWEEEEEKKTKTKSDFPKSQYLILIPYLMPRYLYQLIARF